MGEGHISTTRGIGGKIHVARYKYGVAFALSLVCQGAIAVPMLLLVIGCVDTSGLDNNIILKLLHFLQLPLYFLRKGSKAGSSIPSSSAVAVPSGCSKHFG